MPRPRPAGPGRECPRPPPARRAPRKVCRGSDTYRRCAHSSPPIKRGLGLLRAFLSASPPRLRDCALGPVTRDVAPQNRTRAFSRSPRLQQRAGQRAPQGAGLRGCGDCWARRLDQRRGACGVVSGRGPPVGDESGSIPDTTTPWEARHPPQSSPCSSAGQLGGELGRRGRPRLCRTRHCAPCMAVRGVPGAPTVTRHTGSHV